MTLESRDNYTQEVKSQEKSSESIDNNEKLDYNKEKELIKLLTQKQLGVLKLDVVSNYLLNNFNFDLKKYDEITQKRFVDEINNIFEEFKDFDESMLGSLKNIRESMSFGVENSKSLEYYRTMIIDKKIEKRIIILKEAQDTMNGERISINGTDYNKNDYTSFTNGISKLDSQNGLNLGKNLDLQNYGYSLKESFAKEIKLNLDKKSPNYSLVINDLNRLSQVSGDKGFENLKKVVLKNGNIINLEELYGNYNDLYKSFKTKNKVFELGNRQLQFAKSGFGFSQEKYGLGYNELEEAYEDKILDIENMRLEDLVIMLRVLFGIIPVAGDVIGGIDDFKQANSGINFDGSIQSIPENLMGYITGILGVSVIGGKFGNVMKGAKFAKVVNTLGKLLNRLENIQGFEKLSSNKAFMTLLDSMSKISPKAREISVKLNNPKQKGSDIDPALLEQRQEKSFSKTGISPEELINRSKKWELSQESRLSDANSYLLQNELQILTPKQFEAVMFVHNDISKGLWQNELGDLKKMTQYLKNVGLNNKQIRILIENGVLGKIMDRKTIIKNVIQESDHKEKVLFLKTATLDDFSILLNHGYDLGDDFSGKFSNILGKIFTIYEKNILNYKGIENDIKSLISDSGGLGEDELSILNSIVGKMSIEGKNLSFRNKFSEVTNIKDINHLIQELPLNTSGEELIDVFETTLERLSGSINNQKDIIFSINTLFSKYPNFSNEIALITIKYTDPSLWKESRVFTEGKTNFSVKGEEFKSVLSFISEKNPKKLIEIMGEGDPGGLYILSGMKQQAKSINKHNIVEFQDNFVSGISFDEASKLLGKKIDDISRKEISLLTDYYRLNILLGEHKDSKFLSVSEITSLVGKVNIDRFFALSYPTLKEIAKNNQELKKQLDKLIVRFNKD